MEIIAPVGAGKVDGRRVFRKSMSGKAAFHGGGADGPARPARGDVVELLELFAGHHAGQLRLCDRLEAIADSLPENAGPNECLGAARALMKLVRDAHEFEESRLWPALRGLRPKDGDLEACIERLRLEHREDESYGEEVAAALTDWGMCAGNRNPEATGYLLRGFFEGMRRHIASERERIVPVLERALEARR